MDLLLPGCEPRCSACAHRGWSAAASHEQKTSWLAMQLAPWRAVLRSLQTVAESERLGYRDKVCLSAAWTQGDWQFGFRRRDEFISIPDCPVHTSRVRNVLRCLQPALPPAKHFPLAFYAQSGAQATLVLKTSQPPALDWLKQTVAAGLQSAGLQGLWWNLHPSAGRRLFAKRGWRLLWGVPRARDDDGLWYGPGAFRQLIPSLYRRSLAQAGAFLQPTPTTVMIDLYCGLGAGLRQWTRCGAPTIGVELGAEAVCCARRNAPQAAVLRGACAQRLPQLRDWVKAQKARQRLLYLNPPRTGLEPEVIAWIAEYQPCRIAYLSCSSGTLGRDLQSLEGSGYRVVSLIPYDFFPQTYHVEVMALLQQVFSPPCPTAPQSRLASPPTVLPKSD